jgi:long-chain acyl-CoA synthetase
MSVVSRWAEDRNISFLTFTDLSQKVEVAELVRGEIARVNTFLPEHARVRRFANFPKELDPDEGELTRTRKLRREFLAERYGVLIEAMYGGRDDQKLDIAVTYQDGRKGTLSAHVAIHDVVKGSAARNAAEQLRAIA